MITNKNNKKISDISGRDVLPIHKDHTWLPAAQYNSQDNSYHNIAVNLQSITDYSKSYSSYLNAYTISYLNSKIDNIKRDVQIIPVDYNTIFSYVTSYSSDLVSYYMDNLNKNMSKLIKETIANNNKPVINPNNSYNNSYNNIVVNLQNITDNLMSYSYYLNAYTISYLNEKISNIKRDVQIIPVDYNTIFSYVTSYSSNLISYYMDNLNKNMSKLITDTISNSNKPGSIVRNNSKKISELTPRDTITKHKDHSWFLVAQYDSRTNSYVNIAMNLATMTGYCTDYTDDQIAYTFDTIAYEYADLKQLEDYSKSGYVQNSYLGNNIISYSFSYSKEYIDWQYIRDNIENLLIQRKLVSINSEEYTPEALEYIHQLVDNEGSLLFDSYTHCIYTLGRYYGGDTLKEDLLFYTRILNLDIDDNEISYISAKGPESQLAFKGKDSITITTTTKDGIDVIEIGNDVSKFINQHLITRKDGSKYRLFINDNGQIDIEEYSEPIISLDIKPLEYDAVDTDEYTLEIPIIIDSSIQVDKWTQFEIITEDCELIDLTNDLKMKVKFIKGQDGIIVIDYNDGITSDEISFEVNWSDFVYYGTYDGDFTYEEKGKYPLGDVENTFIIDQGFYDYAFIMLPKEYDIIIIDDLSSLQGSWYKRKRLEIKNNHEYNVWLTTNEGMGKVRWKIIKNI